MNDKDLEVRKETYRYNGRSWYYVTDLRQMRELAKQGNAYAINKLKNVHKI